MAAEAPRACGGGVLDLAVITAIGSVFARSLVGFEDRLPEYARQVDAAAMKLGVRLRPP